MTDEAPRSSWDKRWQPDSASVAALAAWMPGAAITIVKRAPDGREATRYPATVVETSAPEPWIEVTATWTRSRVEVSGLVFETGDTIREFFSARHPFNAFAVISPGGELRGWYGNVTYPAFVMPDADPPTLVWHDLYLDVVILPGGAMHLLDDDELEESGLPASQPEFAGAIVEARRDLIAAIPMLVPTSGSKIHAHPPTR